jgi:hypothetical protein
MSLAPLVLVHASDFHLDRPLSGLADPPEHLRDLLIDAPFHAAEHVFETALAEKADAVLLAGDIIDVARAGPHGLAFLLDQFARLEDQKIAVYWAGGSVDPPDAWPRAIPLPNNVHVFPVGRVDETFLKRGGEKVARIQGVSRGKNGRVATSGFHRDAGGLVTIGVSHGTEDSAGHEGDRVHYMALGGRHGQETVDNEPGIAHYCGTPQGRTAEETGPHGCTIVHWDEAEKMSLRSAVADAARWLDESLEITASTTEEQLFDRLVERTQKLVAQHPSANLLVSWKIRSSGGLANRLRTGGLSDGIVAELRKRFGQKSPLCWCVSLECDAPLAVPEEWYDHENALGDLLRQFRMFREDPKLHVELASFLPKELADHPLAEIAKIRDGAPRTALLERSAKLGVELLTEPTPIRPRAGTRS